MSGVLPPDRCSDKQKDRGSVMESRPGDLV
jgi:hypothetical protein